MSAIGRVLAVGCDAQLIFLLKAAARSACGLSVETAEMTRTDFNPAALKADALCAALDLRQPGALEDFRRLTLSLPDHAIIAFAQQGDTEDVRRLFRAGAADVLVAPFSAESIAACLSELMQARAYARASEGGRVITMVKAVGGAGATTLGLNLAGLLSRGDSRMGRAPSSTAFLDLDLQFGDSDVALDLQPRTTAVDVLRAGDRLDGRFLQMVLAEHSSGVRLLAPPPSMVPLDAISSDFAPELLGEATSLFARVIVDLPGSWTDWSLQVLKGSDLIVLVTAPTVAGAFGARRVLQALREAQVARPVFLTVNRMDGVIDALEKRSHISRALDHPIGATLAMDPVAARAADRGALVVEAFPNARISKDLRTFAARVEKQLTQRDAVAPTTAPMMTEAFA